MVSRASLGWWPEIVRCTIQLVAAVSKHRLLHDPCDPANRRGRTVLPSRGKTSPISPLHLLHTRIVFRSWLCYVALNFGRKADAEISHRSELMKLEFESDGVG